MTVSHDEKAKRLTVTYDDGKVEQYSNVSTVAYMHLDRAANQVSYIAKYIRPVYVREGDVLDV